MGIDIYARWKDQTEKEEKAQYTGFSTQSGDAGYLREAYHGEPYATKGFVHEAFKESEDAVHIPAAKLLRRLPVALKETLDREVDIYEADLDNIDDVIETLKTMKSFVDFVELCARKEKETGEACEIFASY